MRLALGIAVLGLGWLLGGATASAASHDGLKVGLATAGGELAGGLVGGAAGLGFGVFICKVTDSWECMTPLATTPLGGIGGAFGGAIGGVTLGARSLGLAPSRPRRAVLATEAVGVGVAVIGGLTGSSGVAASGLVIGVVGAPVAAGLATRRGAVAASDGARLQVALSPTVGLHSYGVSLDGRF